MPSRSIACCLITSAVVLTGCGSGLPSDGPAAVRPHIDAQTCDTIRPDVIRVAAGNGVNIVKIYDPVTVKSDAKKAVCSGRALVGSGQQVQISYRNFQDDDGDWLVQYSEERLD